MVNNISTLLTPCECGETARSSEEILSETDAKIAKRITFSGKDWISTCKNIRVAFTTTEGERLTLGKPFYTETCFDTDGNEFRIRRLSLREPKNESGWIQRKKRESSVNEILRKFNLEPILSKKRDTELENLLCQLKDSDREKINTVFPLLQEFAEKIVQDKTSDFIDIQLAIRAIVTRNLYMSARFGLEYDYTEAQEFCDSVAEDIYQGIATHYMKGTRPMELIVILNNYMVSRQDIIYTPEQLHTIRAMIVSLTLDNVFTRILPLFIESESCMTGVENPHHAAIAIKDFLQQ